MSDKILFNVYDNDGVNVGMVNKAVVRDCINAGYIFDLGCIPQSVVNKVRPVDFTGAWYPGCGQIKRLYGGDFNSIDHARMSDRRRMRDS